MEGILVQLNVHFCFHDIQDFFQKVRKFQGVPNIRTVFRIDKMQRDKSRFILRKVDPQLQSDQLHGILPKLKLLRVKTLDLPQ